MLQNICVNIILIFGVFVVAGHWNSPLWMEFSLTSSKVIKVFSSNISWWSSWVISNNTNVWFCSAAVNKKKQNHVDRFGSLAMSVSLKTMGQPVWARELKWAWATPLEKQLTGRATTWRPCKKSETLSDHLLPRMAALHLHYPKMDILPTSSTSTILILPLQDT